MQTEHFTGNFLSRLYIIILGRVFGLFSLLTLSRLEKTFSCFFDSVQFRTSCKRSARAKISCGCQYSNLLGVTHLPNSSLTYVCSEVICCIRLEAIRIFHWSSVIHHIEAASWILLHFPRLPLVTCITYEVMCIPFGSSL